MDKLAKIAAAIHDLDNASAAVRGAFDLIQQYHGMGEEYFEQSGNAQDAIEWATARLGSELPDDYSNVLEALDLRSLPVEAQIAKIDELVAAGTVILSVAHEISRPVLAHPMSVPATIKILDSRGFDSEFTCSAGEPAEHCVNVMRGG